MKRLAVLTIACAAIVAAAGCNPSTVTLATEDNGSSVTLDVGQTLEINLPSNPSTGYSWQSASIPACLEPAGASRFESEAEEDVVGASGTETLTFEATKVGTGLLELEYEQAWLPDAEPADTFSVDVTVAE